MPKTQPTTGTPVTADIIKSIPKGRSWAMRSAQTFVHCARRDGQYAVECGWVVNEAFDDDYMSSTYHPFRPAHPQPWVGRSVTTTDPDEAARIYTEYKSAVLALQGNTLAGEEIGSVFR